METTRKKVLVVDDDQDFRAQLGIELEAAGFDVAPAGAEAEALSLLESGRPDLAILDLMMEHMDSGLILAHR